MRTKYFMVDCGQNVKRVKNGCVTCSFGLNDWRPSIYTVDKLLRDSEVKQITRDEARKRFPKAFRKA